jgi:hypothetical protein
MRTLHLRNSMQKILDVRQSNLKSFAFGICLCEVFESKKSRSHDEVCGVSVNAKYFGFVRIVATLVCIRRLNAKSLVFDCLECTNPKDFAHTHVKARTRQPTKVGAQDVECKIFCIQLSENAKSLGSDWPRSGWLPGCRSSPKKAPCACARLSVSLAHCNFSVYEEAGAGVLSGPTNKQLNR